MRAFSKALSMSPSHLSGIINGHKIPSAKLIKQILERLNTDTLLAKDIIKDLVSQGSEQCFKKKELDHLSEENLKLISDWAYFAVLSLTYVKKKKFDAKWISSRLGIEFSRAEEVLQRLLRLKLLKVEGNSYVQNTKPLHTSVDVPSESIRNIHKNYLSLAAEKIDAVPVGFRDYTAVTFHVDMKKLAEAKKMINNFKLELSDFLCSGDTTEVYTMCIQLFPLTELGSYEK